MNGMINAKAVPNISVRMAIAVIAVLPLMIRVSVLPGNISSRVSRSVP
jgi:hypothetical protein